MSKRAPKAAVVPIYVEGCPCLSCEGLKQKGAKPNHGATPAERALASLRPLSGSSRFVMSVLCQGHEVLSVTVRPWGKP